MRNATAYSITKNALCFECHGKPDKGQEDFDHCCCHPGNTFLCEMKRLGLHSQIRTIRHNQECSTY